MQSFKWINYHELATTLYKERKEEYIRSAISRDYYACFNLCKNYLVQQRKIQDTKKTNVHIDVSRQLRESKNEKEKEIGKILHKFRKLRNKSDYDADKQSSIKILNSKNKCQIYSKTILKILKKLKNE